MKTLRQMLQDLQDENKISEMASSSEDLAVELVMLDREQGARITAMEKDAKAEAARIVAEGAAIKRAQDEAAAEAYGWMKVFNELSDRGMSTDAAMEAIKANQDCGHTAKECLRMLSLAKPNSPKKDSPKKDPPRPESFGSWA